MKVFTRDQEFSDFVLAYEITENQLKRVIEDPQYFYDHEFVSKINQEKGCHLLIVMLQSTQGLQIILSRMKDLLQQYQSVCWYSRGHQAFFQRRKPC